MDATGFFVRGGQSANLDCGYAGQGGLGPEWEVRLGKVGRGRLFANKIARKNANFLTYKAARGAIVVESEPLRPTCGGAWTFGKRS